MTKDIFRQMIGELDKKNQYAVIVLRTICSNGGYSSGQSYIHADVDTIRIFDGYIKVPAAKNKEDGFSPFDCRKFLKGNEPILVPYEEIVCVIGSQKSYWDKFYIKGEWK